MIPRDKEFDVYVSEGVLVEVWRGEHVSIAQPFGEDWDGEPKTAVTSKTFVRVTEPLDSWQLNARRCVVVLACAWLAWAVASISVFLWRLW